MKLQNNKPTTNFDPEHPHTYPYRILLAVTGLSPQVVTETLYALAVLGEPAFIPTEIILITTRTGAEHARLNLLSEEPGWFHRLCREYDLPHIAFDSDRIRTIPDAEGHPAADIRTPRDNEQTADFVVDTVRQLTEDKQAALHISLAGGRKTMGYYLGYALSLYGRRQDRLSHVLVSPPFESHPQFFYPTPEQRIIYSLDKQQSPLDCHQARVELADIPFVRMREELPQTLLNGRAKFSEVVAEAQRALPPLALCLHPETHTVTAGGETFSLKPAEFAFYWLLAERCRQHSPGIHWSETDIEKELLDYYRRLVGEYSAQYEKAEETLKQGVTKEFFEPRKAKVNKAIKKVLGERRAKPYLVVKLEKIPGTQYHRYGLALASDVVRVEEI
ncbi:MAG: hypothetical protein Kow0060_19260 [Methylohalobius crimeensis]